MVGRPAAALLHVSRPTVEKYIKAGELPSLTIGRCRRIRRTDLENFLDSRVSHGWRQPALEPPAMDAPPDYPADSEAIAF